jgi:predicted Zn-dependent peptidase
MKTLESATPESLRTLYAQSFRPDQALLLVVGSFDSAQLSSQIDKLFGAWKAGTVTPPQVKEPAARTDHKIYFVERPGSVQTTMLIGAVGPTMRNPDEPFLKLANTIYGGSFDSRLTRNIREDKGYTYSPYSYTTSLRWSGAVLTSEDVRNQVTGARFKETFYELKRISTEPPITAELDQAQRYLIGNTALDLQSRASLAEKLGKYWIDGEPANHLTQEMETIENATLPAVSQAAAKYLAPDLMTAVAVGEKSVILEQLKPFGIEIVQAPEP